MRETLLAIAGCSAQAAPAPATPPSAKLDGQYFFVFDESTDRKSVENVCAKETLQTATACVARIRAAAMQESIRIAMSDSTHGHLQSFGLRTGSADEIYQDTPFVLAHAESGTLRAHVDGVRTGTRLNPNAPAEPNLERPDDHTLVLVSNKGERAVYRRRAR